MRTVTIPMEELAALLQLQLDSSGSARLTVTGCSMYPMLRHGKDTVTLAPVSGPLGKGDLPLYRRENGAYVLHRILRRTKEGYLCCGDNQWQTEAVTHSQLLAVVTGFTRGGKTYSVTHRGYRLYVWLWVGLYPLRRYLLAVRRRLGRLRSAIRRYKRK